MNPKWSPEFTGKKPSFNNMGAMRLNPDYSGNNGLVALWLMNEGAGVNLCDLAIKRSIGTLSGAAPPTWSSSNLGPAIAFPGVSGYISTMFQAAGAIKLTLNYWAYKATGKVLSMGQYDSETLRYNLVWFSDNNLYGVGINNASGNYGYTALTTFNAWTMVTLVLDATQASYTNQAKIYVNGLQRSLTFFNTGNIRVGTFTNPLYLGRYESTTYSTGMMASASVYTTALTPDNVLNLYYRPYGTPDNPRFLFAGSRSYFFPSGGATPSFKTYWIPQRNRSIGIGVR